MKYNIYKNAGYSYWENPTQCSLNPDQFEILVNTYSEEILDEILVESELDVTLAFFEAMKFLAENDYPIPNYWALKASEMLIKVTDLFKNRPVSPETISSETGLLEPGSPKKSIEPEIKDALRIKGKTRDMKKEEAYIYIINYYMLKLKKEKINNKKFVKEENKTNINVQNEAIDETIDLIKSKSSNNNSIGRTKLSGMLRKAATKAGMHLLIQPFLDNPDYPDKWLEGIEPDKIINR